MPSRASHSLGVASLVVAILSFFVCWMPVIGLLLGGLGLLLGVSGLIIAVVRKGAGIGYSIAGSAVSAISLLLGLAFAAAISSFFSGMDKAMHTSNPTPQAQPVSKSDPVPTVPPSTVPKPMPQSIDGGTLASSTASEPAGAMRTATAPRPSEEKSWIAADSFGGKLHDIYVKIDRAKIGKVPLHDAMGGDSESADSLLTIWLTVQNKSERKKLDYRTWGADATSMFGSDVSLKDDAGNTYKRIRFSFSDKIKGAESSTSIYPGKEIRDAIVFELPIEKIEYLELVLPGKHVDEEGELRFRIPKAMIK